MKEKRYAELVKVAENGPRMTRWEMVCWCIGYYKVLDEITWDCIKKLYADNFIDE